jgi:hypothetical protein
VGGPEHKEGFVKGFLTKATIGKNGKKLFPHGSACLPRQLEQEHVKKREEN